jgi:hypothetical protein
MPRRNGRPEVLARVRANNQVSTFEKAERNWPQCARRSADSITLSCWRCSNTASSPLSVRVGVDFDRTWLFRVFITAFLFKGFTVLRIVSFPVCLPFGRLWYDRANALAMQSATRSFSADHMMRRSGFDTTPHPMNILPQSMKRLCH